MQITVLFFAKLKEITNTPKMSLAIAEGACIRDLRTLLGEKYPDIKNFLPSVIVSINQEFAFDDDLIVDQAEIAFFPPVSGGMESTILLITSDDIDLNALLKRVTQPTTGAAAIFSGIIRGETGPSGSKTTIGLEYEAYQPMAEAKLKQIAQEIRDQWQSVESIVMVQRVGYMDAGTPTVCVICTAAHRNTGVFEAAKYGIDRIKEIVPVWKKEIGPNNEEWVEGDYHPQKSDLNEINTQH